MILDTSFVIDVFQGAPAATSLREEIDEAGTAGVSAITAFELAKGIERSGRTDRERDRVLSFLNDAREIQLDREIAFEAASIATELDRAGTPVEIPDVFVAATARVMGEPVVTGNPEHFGRIAGLDVRSYDR